ncbi:MAG: glycosyltransferase family 4 protein [Candidatus Nanopelagicales bacterium]
MRVGLVCPYAWDVPGGVQAHVKDLAEALIRLGHDVSVLAPVEGEGEVPDYVVDGGRPVAVPYNGSVARLNFGLKPTRRVRRWIRTGDFDVVHVHEPVSPSLSVLACWAAEGPLVATWHSSMGRSRVLTAGYYLAQTAMEKIRARIAVSEYARRTLVDHLGGDAVLIPNGVDCASFERAEPLPGWPGDGPALMFLGRLDEPRKGLDVLLGALPAMSEALPGLRLLVVGPGDQEDAVKGLPDRLRDRVVFLGRVSDEDKARAFHSVDLYVAPNTGGESFGIVLLESMAAGTPVLASDLDAFRRVLEDGRSGVVFRNGDSADLAAKAVALLHDADERGRLVEAGRARAWQFDWSRVALEVLAVYESVTVTGEKVREDLRGQLVGRLSGRGNGDA